MMKVKIPHELKMKFVNFEGLRSHCDTYEVQDQKGIKHTVPGETYYNVELDLNDHPDLLNVCIEWNLIIMTYFQTSREAYRATIGPYEGIWPRVISDGIVHFHVDYVNKNHHNWKDWFSKEDIEICIQAAC